MRRLGAVVLDSSCAGRLLRPCFCWAFQVESLEAIQDGGDYVVACELERFKRLPYSNIKPQGIHTAQRPPRVSDSLVSLPCARVLEDKPVLIP